MQKNHFVFLSSDFSVKYDRDVSSGGFAYDYCMVKCVFSGSRDSSVILGSGPELPGVWMEMTGVRELVREQHKPAKTSCEPQRHTMSGVMSQETWTYSRTVRARSSTSL